MDDRRLDMVEDLLARHSRQRVQSAGLPGDFTARVMAEAQRKSERKPVFAELFALAARRFAPAGVLAATALYGYSAYVERLFSQALLSLNLSGGGLMHLAALMP